MSCPAPAMIVYLLVGFVCGVGLREWFNWIDARRAWKRRGVDAAIDRDIRSPAPRIGAANWD